MRNRHEVLTQQAVAAGCGGDCAPVMRSFLGSARLRAALRYLFTSASLGICMRSSTHDTDSAIPTERLLVLQLPDALAAGTQMDTAMYPIAFDMAGGDSD